MRGAPLRAALSRSVELPSDPDFDKVSLLLHMEGADASTTFTDHSSNGHTVTANGNAQIDTAQKKAGSASGLFDGTGDYLSVDDVDFSVQTDDYTIEGWLRTDSFAAVQGVTFNGTFGSNNSRFQIDLKTNGKVTFYGSGSGWNISTASGVVSLNTWHHFAAVMQGTTARIFIDGVGASLTTGTKPGTGTKFFVGYARNASLDRYFSGHLDEIRFTKGLARYTADFTPPSPPFPNQ